MRPAPDAGRARLPGAGCLFDILGAEYKIWRMTASRLAPAPDDTDWKTMFPEPVAVLGYGVEGRSTVRHLLQRGYRDVVVLDREVPSEALPEGVRGVFGARHLDALDTLDTLDAADAPPIRTVFRAPGVRPFVPALEAFVARGGLLTSQVEAVFALLGGARIVGVTGTVGKGTCCSLLSAMLTAAGMPHRLAGNIGVPPLDALSDFTGEHALPADAVLLLELSSFQLCTVRESPRVAVVLRTTTEHLDWHADRTEYWDHKANLVRFQKADDVVVSFAGAEGSRWIGALGAGRRVTIAPGEDAAGIAGSVAGRTGLASGGAERAPEEVVRLSATEAVWDRRDFRLALTDTNMTGAFNLENIAAAAAAAFALGVPETAVRAGARQFAPLEHRIEFVRAHAGIRYFNDSYATRPDAALAAVRAFRGQSAPAPDSLAGAGEDDGAPLGLILGGSEKNADFSELAHALKEETHVRAIAFIGHTAARLEAELEAAGALAGRAHRRCDSLEEALEYLRGEIRAGVILLSPACASFGLFANYKERGKAFKRLVRALGENNGS